MAYAPRRRRKTSFSPGGGAGLPGLTSITLTSDTVPEDAAPGTVVGTLLTVPSIANLTLIDDAGGRFEIDGEDLVTGATPFDYETATEHTVVIRAERGVVVNDVPLTVTVTNVNDLAFSLDAPASVSEGSAQDDVIGALVSVPAGASFTLIDDAGGRFVLDGDNLVVGATPFDYEVATEHEVTIEATLNGETRTEVITISVSDLDEVSDITLSANSIAESAAAGAVVGALTSTPAGATFSLTNTAGGRFAISGNNLVRGATALDYEANSSHQVTVRATRLGETYDETFTINVTDVDEVSDITLSANSIAENASTGTVVGALTSTPAGATFTLTDTAGNRFAISGNNLVRGATALNYENATSHQVTVRATRLGETYDETFTINVTNVNEITNINLSSATVSEDASPGQTVGALTSTPGGASFTLTNTAGGRFAISGTNLVTGATGFDYESATSHDVTVRASLGADQFDRTFTISVSDVNEAPPEPEPLVPDNLSISPGNTSAIGTDPVNPPTTGGSTMNPNGSGSGSGYSYLWEIESGDDLVINSPNSQSTTFTGLPGTKGAGTRVTIVRCTVTDGAGAVGSRTTQVQITWS